jgi:XTP/dITP diphosphohydrolase
MRACVVATGNPGKLAEIRDCSPTPAVELSRKASSAFRDADETGTTFVENALIKARHASRL